MTAFVWTAVIFAGGVGAVLRLLVDAAVTRWFGARYPHGITVVNISGAFALGTLAAIALPPSVALIAGTGALGAYTTFSTWMLQTFELAGNREIRYAVANLVIPAVAGFAAAAAGYALGAAI